VRLGDIAEVHLGGQFRQGLLADGYQEHVGAIIGMRVREDPKTVIDAVKRRLPICGRRWRASSSPPFRSTTAPSSFARNDGDRHAHADRGHPHHHHCGGGVSAPRAREPGRRVSLPLGMLFTFLVMHGFGIGANIMSLAGIAIAIGVMVDFGIIMTENITQHLVDLQEQVPEREPADADLAL
jgi:Cu(I)/Ag(I) efflux system membrane protein CusA/SilA